MAFTIVTVNAKYLLPDKTPATGTVTFALSAQLKDGSADEIIEPIPVTVSLNNSGSISVALVANDDVTTVPTGSTYSVTETIAGAPTKTYSITVPKANATINLADIAP